MKSKLSMKILGIVVTIATLASLLVGITAAPVSAAAPGANVWTTTDTPSNVNNVLGGVNYPGGVKTQIGNPSTTLLATTSNGVIFAWDDTNKTMYKSTDGVNWGTTANIITTGAAVGLATSPNYATDGGAVVLATPTQIWVSTDGGTTWGSVAMGGITGITSVDLGYWYVTGGTTLTILIGSTTAGVQYMKWVVGSAWTPVLNASSVALTNVYAVKFSPQAATDGEILSVLLTGGNLVLSSDFGSLGWNYSNFPDKIIVASTAPTSVTIALPSDYVGNTGASILVGIVGGAPGTVQGLYRVSGRINVAGNVTGNIWANPVKSLAISGPMATATVYATFVADGNVFKSTNITTATPTFTGAAVTGNSAALGLVGSVVYAGTWGPDSAINVSNDAGVSFQQVGLIDTGALVGGLLNVSLVNFTAVDANTMFLVMANGAGTLRQYVFKTVNAGVSWQRIYSSPIAVGTAPLKVAVSTVYATDGGVVVISDGTNVIRKSINGGMVFTPYGTVTPGITAVWVTDSANIFVGALGGGVYKIGSIALSTGLPVTAATDSVVSFALNAAKTTLMVGLRNGKVYETAATATAFTQVGSAVPGGTANYAYVAYGPDGTRYAAIGTSGGVFKFGTAWTAVVATTALGNATGVAVSTDGTLYAADLTPGNSVFRTMNPTATTPDINQLNFANSAWTTGGTASGLAVISGTAANSIYTIDGVVAAGTSYLYAGRIRGFSDTLIVAPATTAPANNVLLATDTSATVSWPAVTGAFEYLLSVDGSPYASVGNVTSWVIGGGVAPFGTLLTQGTTHTWSVRVGKTNASAITMTDLGRPSATLSFTTALTAPIIGFTQYPANGSMNISVNPLFTWPAGVAGSTYEFVISEASDVNTAAHPFSIITDSFGVLSNTTLLNAPLKYSTQYYWEVRTVTGTSKSAWTVGTFITVAAPVVTTPATTTPPVTTIIVPTQPAVTPTVTIINSGTPVENTPVIPTYLLWAVIAVGAVLVIAVIVLIVRTRRIQ
jgi:hypothetical protein